MFESQPVPEVLRAFVRVQSDAELFELLDRHEGLDEYVVPMMALLKAISMLSLVNNKDADRNTEGPVVELVSTPPRGDPIVRIVDGKERDGEDYIPVMLSIAHQSASNFLNERGYQLLNAMVETEEDPEMYLRLHQYRAALRGCLDRGMNNEWLMEKEEKERQRHEKDSHDPVEEKWHSYFMLRELLKAENEEEIATLLVKEPWMKIYAEGIPFQFDPGQQALRNALAQFCEGGSWAQRRRGALSILRLTTSEATNLLESIEGIARENATGQPVHAFIAYQIKDDIQLLNKCISEGADTPFLDLAPRYIMGVW
jgi:hypothetical protein